MSWRRKRDSNDKPIWKGLRAIGAFVEVMSDWDGTVKFPDVDTGRWFYLDVKNPNGKGTKHAVMSACKKCGAVNGSHTQECEVPRKKKHSTLRCFQCGKRWQINHPMSWSHFGSRCLRHDRTPLAVDVGNWHEDACTERQKRLLEHGFPLVFVETLDEAKKAIGAKI